MDSKESGRMKLIKKLPDTFMLKSGDRVASAEDWRARRSEIAKLLLEQQYGTMPPAPDVVNATTGNWVLEKSGRKHRTDSLWLTPNQEKPRTSFKLGLTITYPTDDAIAKRKSANPQFDQDGLPALIYVGGKTHNSVLDSGYVIINYPNDTIEPTEIGKPKLGPAREAYQALYGKQYSWGSISAWAWGARRILDHAIRLPEINKSRVAISGHSRNGKTALLAGGLDERFAVVNPAGSGCAGAGSYLALGDACEDLAAMTSRDRWWAWAHPDFESYSGNEADLPFDQHFLMSLVAPRPLLRTEGVDDDWANPEGTSVSYLGTQPIYDFLNVGDRNTIFYRSGGHDHTEEDAAALVAVCDEHFFCVSLTQDLSKVLPQTPPTDQLFDWVTPG
jgi:hypothetical protein